MNIHIIKNARGVKGKNISGGRIAYEYFEDSKYTGIKRQYLYLYNTEKNESIEIEPEIIKYNIALTSDVRLNNEYLYFTSIVEDEKNDDDLNILLYRYDVNEEKTSMIFSYSEKLEKYENFMRTKFFVLNDYYILMQNEFLRSNLTETYDDYFDFELYMFNIIENKKYKISDEKLNQCGIVEFLPISSNNCIVKTGYDLFTDDRYKFLTKDESVVESISLINVGQMISDVIIGKSDVVMNTIESVYYTSTIPYVKVEGDYFYYSKVKTEDELSEEIVFYNYKKKESLMCINSQIKNGKSLAKPFVSSGKPYVMILSSKGYEFIEIENPKNIQILDSSYEIKDIVKNVVITTLVSKGMFGKIKDYVYVFKLPSLQLLHREKGQYENYIFSRDGELNIMLK